MTSNLLVSVIVPAYNAEAYLAEAVRSVLVQRRGLLEVLVVDDGSTDGTATVAGGLAADRRVRVIRQANAGVATARNRGLAAARGRYIAFLDADDVWDPDKLDRQLDLLTSDPALVAVGCRMRYLGPGGQVVGHTGQALTEIDRAAVASGRLLPFPLSSSVFRREALDRIGGFDASLDREVPGQVEDLDLFARVVRLGELAVVPKVLGGYRIHGRAASAKSSRQRLSARYVRARLEAERQGQTVSYREWLAGYRPTLTQRWTDRAQWLYREAGRHALMGRRITALGQVLLATAMSPGYVARRLPRQLHRS